mgnify:CR=1 FL=1
MSLLDTLLTAISFFAVVFVFGLYLLHGNLRGLISKIGRFSDMEIRSGFKIFAMSIIATIAVVGFILFRVLEKQERMDMSMVFKLLAG